MWKTGKQSAGLFMNFRSLRFAASVATPGRDTIFFSLLCTFISSFLSSFSQVGCCLTERNKECFLIIHFISSLLVYFYSCLEICGFFFKLLS